MSKRHECPKKTVDNTQKIVSMSNKINHLYERINMLECCQCPSAYVQNTVYTKKPIVGSGGCKCPVTLEKGSNPGDTLVWNGNEWIPQPVVFQCWEESCGTDVGGKPYAEFHPKVGTDRSTIIAPKGSGYFALNIPDGATNGDTRGNNAVDLQLSRKISTQVASGDNASILSGNANTASGTNSVVIGGNNNIAQGTNSVALGSHVSANGDSSLALGRNSVGGTINSSINAAGSIAGGVTLNTGLIQTIGEGSIAFGEAINSSSIISSGIGSLAHGFTDNSNQLLALGNGSTVLGRATGGTSIIRASGGGSFASGHVNGNPGSNFGIFSAGLGSHALGSANDDSIIVASGEGSLATGRTLNNSGIVASGFGSFAGGGSVGGGKGPGLIFASSFGSFAYGDTNNGVIESMNNGTVAFGIAQQGAKISTTGVGAFATGISTGTANISSASFGSIAQGDANNSLIEAKSSGSLARGTALGNSTMSASGRGSTATGEARVNCQLLAKGRGSTTAGFANNGSTISAINDGSSATGLADGLSKITVENTPNGAEGGMARGYALISSNIISSQDASLAQGFVFNNSKIEASGVGSVASGAAPNQGTITSTDSGSHTFGVVYAGELLSSDAEGAMAFGRNVETGGNKYCLIVGKHGKALTTGNSSPDLPLIQGEGSIQIAGGVDTSSKNTTSSQGISVIIGTRIAGATPIGAGAANAWYTNGADYAEFFEWDDGNNANEDRCGYFVQLEGKTIKIAGDSSDVLGISGSTNGTPGYIGDMAEFNWSKVHATDELLRIKTKETYTEVLFDLLTSERLNITEEIKNVLSNYDGTELLEKIKECKFNKYIPITKLLESLEPVVENEPPIEIQTYELTELTQDEKDVLFEKITKLVPRKCAITNPLYDPSQTYIPRSQRKEWTVVSLLGKVVVRDNGECVPGRRCSCLNGIAVPGEQWMVMERISDKTIKIFFK